MSFFQERYPQALGAYKLTQLPQREEEENDVAYGYRLLQLCARSGACAFPEGNSTPSAWPGCCWTSTVVASWDALPLRCPRTWNRTEP